MQLDGFLRLFGGFRRPSVAAAAAALCGLALLLWMCNHWRHRLLDATGFVLLGFSPFVAVTFGLSAWRMVTYDDSGFRDKPTAPVIEQRGLRAARVLWIVFDEWDHRLTFETGREFPGLRRFRATALDTSNAYPAAGETVRSMAAFIKGKIVREAEPVSPDTVRLGFSDGEHGWLGSGPSLFSKAKEAGLSAAVVGWRLPYGRLFNGHLVSSWWAGLPQRWNLVSDVLVLQFRTLFESGTLSTFGRSALIEKHAWIYREVLERGKRLAVNPAIGLALVHFPVPHLPAIYDPATGRLERRYSTPGDYFDNLALVDRTLLELREAMERADTWASTTILLSSDHWYRDATRLDGKVDHRVPFLLKLAGQTQGVVYREPFNTVLTHDLLLAILRGELTTPEQVVAWLDVHRLTPEGQYRP